jgi:hypothetical protein
MCQLFFLWSKTNSKMGKTEAERVEAANIKLQSELQHLKLLSYNLYLFSLIHLTTYIL